MKLITTLLRPCLLALLPLSALAQDRDGNDTPGDWQVKHHRIYDIWNSICDERTTGDTLTQRCYLRRVDVFSGRPEFAAQFLFITPASSDWEVEFGMEAGTLFHPNGFRIDIGDTTSWQTRRPGCLTGLRCRFTGQDADELLAAMHAGGAFRFTFRDRNGNAQDLSWPLEGFPEAWEDFQAQSRQRGLWP